MKPTGFQVFFAIMISMVMAAGEDITSPEGLTKVYACRNQIRSNFRKKVSDLQHVKKIVQDCLDVPTEVLDCIDSKFEEKEILQIAAVKVGLSCIPDLSNLTKSTLFAYFIGAREFAVEYEKYRPYIESMTEEQVNAWRQRPGEVVLDELRTGGDEAIEKFAQEIGVPRGFLDELLKYDVYARQHGELSSTLEGAERVALQKYKILTYI